MFAKRSARNGLGGGLVKEKGSYFPLPCGHTEAATTDTRPASYGRRRRIECVTCHQRFTTHETVEDATSARERMRLTLALGRIKRALDEVEPLIRDEVDSEIYWDGRNLGRPV